LTDIRDQGRCPGRGCPQWRRWDERSAPRWSFTKEFKAEVVALVRQPGNTAASVARDLDLSETAVRDWVEQADIDDGQRDGLTTVERAELAQLRKEVRVLREAWTSSA